MPFHINCPECGVGIRVPAKREGTEVPCPKCGKPFIAAPASPPDDPTQPPDEPPLGVLETIEVFLWRMIAGVFRFAFAQLPRLLYDLLFRSFPTLVRLVKVMLLLVVWIGVALLPGWIGLNLEPFLERAGESVQGGRVLIWCNEHPTTCRVALITWSGVALCGSIWGVIFIRRRARRRARGSTPDYP